ncbi:hypothetical protein PAXINDRAFT_11032 [Paxillus involutus ATCC 200175]|nr:hypothetical protein PAXINDRAFT_11032 [Paxillus involutus ATCC 200175]
MISVGELVLSALASAAACGLWTFFYHLRTPLRHLPGPKGTSLIYGNLLDISMGDNLNSIVQEVWVKEYGKTLKFKGFFGTDRLLTVDTCTINHILTHASDYAKPSYLRRALAQILGEGVLFAEDVQHRQQRRILNPAFGPAQIRGLTDIFLAKAIRLRDLWSSEIANTAANTNGARLEMMSWLSRMTLDVISLAGKLDFLCFNYNINALSATEKPNELNVAFATVLSAFQKIDALFALQVLIPFFRSIPNDHARKIRASQHTVKRIAKGLLAKAKAAVLTDATEKGGHQSLSTQPQDKVTHLNSWASGPHKSFDRWITKIGMKITLPLVILFSKIEMRFMAGRREIIYLTPSCITPFLSVNGFSSGKTSSFIATRMVSPMGGCTRKVSFTMASRPERWDDLPNAVSNIPGVWGHQLTFLGGPRACIAYRFSIIEMKVLLFTLVRAFEFEPAVPAGQIGKRGIFLQRPILRGDPTHKAQLPLFVKRYQRGD